MTETFREVLERLSRTTSSSDTDSSTVELLCRRLGFPKARVVLGVVYLEGHGTIESPPTDIHSIAKVFLNAAKKQG
jgi:hypothetical protein